jgi:S-formylglutathione hydrolase FrmB
MARWLTLSLMLPTLLLLSAPRMEAVRAASKSRLQEITLESTALGVATKVNVLLPDGYAVGTTRYPVLYLLHGYAGAYSDWTHRTDLVAFTRHLPLIVVMPEGGNGWYMDPVVPGSNWETYHIRELIPYIDSHLRTIATRSGRAIAGLSMGGMGAFVYAARHPDLFVAAASFSGVLHAENYHPFIDGALMAPADVFEPVCGQSVWCLRAHDPVDLASNLRGLPLFLSAGSGKRGPLDRAYAIADGQLEASIHQTLVSMATALRGAHIPAEVDDYGPGTHTWPYFERELHRALPMLLAAFAKPPAAPSNWSYRTADSSAGVWGYSIAVTRTAGTDGYTDLTGVAPRGFTVSGTGTVTVITAPSYVAGQRYAIRQGGKTQKAIAADAHGRLHLVVRLGGRESTTRISIGS